MAWTNLDAFRQLIEQLDEPMRISLHAGDPDPGAEPTGDWGTVTWSAEVGVPTAFLMPDDGTWSTV